MPNSASNTNLTAHTLSDDDIMEQAAEWLVKLSSEACCEKDLIDFEAWKQQSQKHRTIADEMRATLDQFEQIQSHSISSQLPSQIIENTLSVSTHQHLFHHLSLFIVITVLVIGIISWTILPTEQWLADYKNKYNQWSEQRLLDHSEIQISGASAFDVDFDRQQRLVQLYKGNILVHVAKDTQRPFIIQTQYAKITALGTRFIVQQQPDATIILMLESKTKIESLKTNQHALELNAGESIRIDRQGLHQIESISENIVEQAWNKHLYVAQQQPLDQVIAHLQHYHKQTFIYNAQELHHIMVNATLPLDASALMLLEQSLPIKVKRNLFGQIEITAK